jgi:hypothetical protein
VHGAPRRLAVNFIFASGWSVEIKPQVKPARGFWENSGNSRIFIKIIKYLVVEKKEVTGLIKQF